MLRYSLVKSYGLQNRLVRRNEFFAARQTRDQVRLMPVAVGATLSNFRLHQPIVSVMVVDAVIEAEAVSVPMIVKL